MVQPHQEELQYVEHVVQDALHAQQQLMEHKLARAVQMNMVLLMAFVLLVQVDKLPLEELPNVQIAAQDAQIVQPLTEHKSALHA